MAVAALGWPIRVVVDDPRDVRRSGGRTSLGAWSVVHVAKWSSWSLLVIMTFTIVANLKHIKETIRVPE